MKQIDFQRRAKRLRELIGDRTIAEFASNIDRSPSQVSNILSGNKRLGERLILHIEATLRLPPGFFDQTTETAPLTPAQAELADALKLAGKVPDEQARLIAALIRSSQK